MLTFTVHEGPDAPADRIDRADALEFVKDGFSWPTAVFPPVGLAGTGLWIAAALYFVGMLLLLLFANAVGMSDPWCALMIAAIHVYMAFELPSLRRWVLTRKGWRTVGVVNGASLEECERRFLESWLPDQPVLTVEPRAVENTRARSSLWPFTAKA